MEKATFNQAGKILDLFGNTPKDQIQIILESGLLADLRDGNIAEVNRDDFRKILGLNSLSVLEFIGTVNILATSKKFVARDHFIVNTSKKTKVKIYGLGTNFQENFLGKIEEPIGKTKLRYHKLRKSSVDKPILAELGDKTKAETTLSEMFALMEMQPNGESGALLTNGYANIFYIRDINGGLWAVYCRWNDGGWYVHADSVENPNEWIGGFQVFSRNPSES